jgi:NAD(P)H-hydrate epimerase
MKLATSLQMQKLDRTTIEEIGVPGVVLMENAGLGTVRALVKSFGPVAGKTVLIFVGPGNNGGDGLVVARHVLQMGGYPYLVYLVQPAKLTGDAGVNAAVVSRLTIPFSILEKPSDLIELEHRVAELHMEHPIHSLVDALFGTGLKRPLEGRFASAVSFLNSFSARHGLPVTAVDIPSGLSADTGEPLGCCVKADLTVTYGLAKPGHYLHGGPDVGILHTVDIGIPPMVVDNAGLPGSLLDASTADLLRPRGKTAHKGTCGHLLIIAGSLGKTGAAILCAQAALRSGCGLVTLAVPAELNPIFETALPEAMTVPLPSSKTFFTNDDYREIASLTEGKKSVVLGPGLGMNSATEPLVYKLYTTISLPMVVDADALNHLASADSTVTQPGGARLLTPHPGEMARLTGMTTREVQADRLSATQWLQKSKIAEGREIITILKGAGTVLGSTHNQWAINSTGNNGMAAGGMGDVLSGLLGGLLAQGYSPWESARLGVYMHGLAADLLAENRSWGFTASEVADALPDAAQILRKSYN